MMNKYVQARVYFWNEDCGHYESFLIFKTYTELLDYLIKHSCKLVDYEEVSIVRRVREKE